MKATKGPEIMKNQNTKKKMGTDQKKHRKVSNISKYGEGEENFRNE